MGSSCAGIRGNLFVVANFIFCGVILSAVVGQVDVRGGESAQASGLTACQVDVMARVFPDRNSEPKEHGEAKGVPRGGKIAFQFALRSDASVLCEMKAGAIRHRDGQVLEGTVRLYHLLWAPVEAHTSNGSSVPDHWRVHLIRQAPFEVAEVLVEAGEFQMQQNKTHAVLIDVHIPADARAGSYRGEAIFRTGGRRVNVPFEFTVHSTVVPDSPRLEHLDWLSFEPENLTSEVAPAWWSERHWHLLEAAGRQLYAFGDRKMNTPLFIKDTPEQVPLIDVYRNTDGSVDFDYARFDRWCAIFFSIGYEKIVGFAYSANWPLPMGDVYMTDRATGQQVKVFWWGPGVDKLNDYEDGTIADDQLAAFDIDDRDQWIPAVWEVFRKKPWYVAEKTRWLDFLEVFWVDFKQHLEGKGWYDKYEQQLIDEPRTTAEYAEMATLHRTHMPGVKISDAIHAYLVPDPENFSDYVDNWETVLPMIGKLQDLVQRRRGQGLKTGVYNLGNYMFPYPNRHLDEHLSHCRVFPWIIFFYGGQSSLNWAPNRYRGSDPYTTCFSWPVKRPGHNWQYYPGPEGLRGSLRLIAWRDGLLDYTLLSMSAEKSPERAKTIMRAVVRSARDYENDSAVYHAARKEILEALED